jgi:hypothetical protein
MAGAVAKEAATSRFAQLWTIPTSLLRQATDYSIQIRRTYSLYSTWPFALTFQRSSSRRRWRPENRNSWKSRRSISRVTVLESGFAVDHIALIAYSTIVPARMLCRDKLPIRFSALVPRSCSWTYLSLFSISLVFSGCLREMKGEHKI